MQNPDTYQALFWGYNIIWLLIAAYVLILRKKINTIGQQLEKKDKNDLES